MNEPVIKNKNCALTVNGGSSNVKFAFFKIDATTLTLSFSGEIADIARKQINLNFQISTNR
ncbi:hypothetical protein A0256_00595 [Mucilaginibacter sp. PAMC 26640]|nr:hypothetical protein A0256_00595 [Mucilaginibacter sp. PAMC 26640]